MKIYILQRHDQAILDKHLRWTHDIKATDVLYTKHRDIAVNQLVELNAKDIDLRAEIQPCNADSKGRPVILLEALNTQQSSDSDSKSSAA
ncbi:MAG: hypothetical protein P8Q37_11010 [Porticoccaceae bacterium]|nr:hypothetical protein [Porticoccaceae bacterium]MDG1475425.1 hypothetical protein [Porticoccaceae bacterium]